MLVLSSSQLDPIEIDEFVEKSEIDPRYLIRPYYLRPDAR